MYRYVIMGMICLLAGNVQAQTASEAPAQSGCRGGQASHLDGRAVAGRLLDL